MLDPALAQLLSWTVIGCGALFLVTVICAFISVIKE